MSPRLHDNSPGISYRNRYSYVDQVNSTYGVNIEWQGNANRSGELGFDPQIKFEKSHC